MKKLLALAVLATSFSAFTAERAIYDLQYLPNAGTTYGFTDFIVADVTSKVSGDSYEVSGWLLNQTVGHSFTDRLSLQASIGYAALETEIEVAGASDETDLKGLSDPTVTARFRVMDEAFRFDVIGGAVISLGDSKTKSNGDQDNRQGGHSLFAGAEIGMKKDYSQWSLLAVWNYDLKSTTDDKADDEEYEDEAHSSLLLQASLLTKIYEKGFIRSFVSAEFENEFETEADSGDFDNESSTTYQWGVEFRHLLSQDLMLKAGVTNNSIRDARAGTNHYLYSIGANYQF